MNETIKTLLNRRSIRKFKSDTVVAITNKALRDRISGPKNF